MYRLYQIAICDDEEPELDKVEQILRAHQRLSADRQFSIRRFLNSKDLLLEIATEEYQPDIIFLDIYLPEQSGIEMAKKLQDMGNKAKIIFLTTSKEHALEAFGVAAAAYLVKPASEQAVFEALDRVFENLIVKQPRYILFETDNYVRRFALDDIIYCEAQRKKQFVYLKGAERITLRMTMAKLCEMLCIHKEFIKLGVSYIVNLEHIERMDMQMLLLDNGREIYLPRGAYKDLREKYFDYYFENRTLAAASIP